MKAKIFVLPLAALLVYAACKKEETDTIAPSVYSIKVNGASNSATVSAGSTMNVTVVVKDNKNLKQYKIDIHDAFDGHDHRNTPFSSQLIYNVSGTYVEETKSVSVPATASSGPYDVLVTCIDESGNQSNVMVFRLTITQTGQPVVNITSPDISNPVVVNLNDTIQMAGTITDDIDLDSLVIELENETNGNLIYGETFVLAGASDTLWDFSELATQLKYIIIPGTASLGSYGLVIRAYDSSGNLTFIEAEVEVQ